MKKIPNNQKRYSLGKWVQQASHFLSQSETNFYSNTVSQSYFLYARDCSLHLRFKSLSLSLYIYIGKFLGGPGLQGWQADLVVPTNKHKTTH